MNTRQPFNQEHRIWCAWQLVSIVSLIVFAIALINTGDQSPWGLETIIVPILIPFAVWLDLRPKRIMKPLLERRQLLHLPRALITVIYIHWWSVALLVAGAVFWHVETLSEYFVYLSLTGVIIYVATGLILLIWAVSLRIMHRHTVKGIHAP